MPHVEDQPLQWSEVERLGPHVRRLATKQLARNWLIKKSIETPQPLWGDEIEYALVTLDDSSQVKALLEQSRLLKFLYTTYQDEARTCFQPEYGRCALESNPAAPYSGQLQDLAGIESSMQRRRDMIEQGLEAGEHVVTITAIPVLGTASSANEPAYPPSDAYWASHDFPTEITTDWKPELRIFLQNIYSRRQSSITMHVPIFQDVNTSWPWTDPFPPCINNGPMSTAKKGVGPVSFANNTLGSTKPNHLLLNDSNYGTLQQCLQVTLQAPSLAKGRQLYDQFVPLTPVMLALTAATPIYKRHLVASDTRWNVMSGALDDRTPNERIDPHIPESRCLPNATYLAADAPSALQNPNLAVDADVERALLAAGMDKPLARHFAYVMRWDPLKFSEAEVAEAERDGESTGLFDQFNGACYQGVRFKPPAGPICTSEMGWRLEFRTMEVQPTDFENAAFAVFVFLVSRVLLEYGVKGYVPFEMLEENFERAHAVAGVVEERFWYRTTDWKMGSEEGKIDDAGSDSGYSTDDSLPSQHHHMRLTTIDAIINGPSHPAKIPLNSPTFPGFIPLIRRYLSQHGGAPARVSDYLSLVSRRASGQSPTPATWVRGFVRSHPGYAGDSVVSERVLWEMLGAIGGREL